MSDAFKECQIIIVEDEAEALEDLIELLEIEGFSAIGFQDGADAIAALERAPQAILITDLEMPKLNGLDLLKRAENIHSLRKIFVISGHSIREPLIDKPFVYLQKPFDFKFLANEIRRSFPC